MATASSAMYRPASQCGGRPSQATPATQQSRARIGSWARAATGHHATTEMRLVRFGDNMRGVAVTEGDKVEAQLRFGASVNTYGVNDLSGVR